MVPKVVAATVLALSLIPSSHRVADLSQSIRPLAWTSEVTDDFGETVSITVRNHCTAWAYRTIANPTVTHWITAAHCILNEDTGAYEDHDYQISGERVYPEVWLWPQDIASLSAGPSAPGLRLAPYAAEIGDRLRIRGYPFGWSSLLTVFGYVGARGIHFPDDPDPVMYDLYVVPIAPGDSGSPVFNTKDQVVGLLQIGWGRGFSPISGGLDLQTLRVFTNLLP